MGLWLGLRAGNSIQVFLVDRRDSILWASTAASQGLPRQEAGGRNWTQDSYTWHRHSNCNNRTFPQLIAIKICRVFKKIFKQVLFLPSHIPWNCPNDYLPRRNSFCRSLLTSRGNGMKILLATRELLNLGNNYGNKEMTEHHIFWNCVAQSGVESGPPEFNTEADQTS